MMPPEHAARRAYDHFVHEMLRFDTAVRRCGARSGSWAGIIA